jgi:predicted RNA binding protein YcfA (HicA-like mRNA interferase family)
VDETKLTAAAPPMVAVAELFGFCHNAKEGRFLPREIVTVREVIKLIEADGWYLARQRSSHRQYKHPTKPGLVTVAGHPPKVLAPKTLKSILRQVGLTT